MPNASDPYTYMWVTFRDIVSHGGADLRGDLTAVVAIQTRIVNFSYQDIGSDTPNSFQWKCESPLGGIANLCLVSKSYFNSTDHAADQLEFMCIWITSRDNNVLQLEITVSCFDNPDPNGCH